MNRSSKMLLAAVMAMGAMALPGYAQNQGGPGQGQGQFGQGQGGQGRGFDPAQIRQTMSDRVKEQLGATDEEWAVLQPKVEKVQKLQADAGGGVSGIMNMFRGRGGQGGPGGGGAQRAGILGALGMSPEMQAALQALQEALDNKDASDVLIKQRMDAIRELRAKAKIDLEAARKELVELLTSRQEAVLFQSGILE